MSLQSLCLRAIIAHDFGDESPEQAVLAAIICESHLGLRAPLLEVLASPDAFARLSTLAVLREAFLSDLLARPKAGAAHWCAHNSLRHALGFLYIKNDASTHF